MDDEIIRIKVRPEAKEVIEGWKKRSGMTEIVIASRIYTWFSRQPEPAQRAILGMMGEDEAEIARVVAESLSVKKRGRK